MRSSNLPVSRAGRASGHLFGLASSGVCRTGLLPDSWCALTAPFHPYLILNTRKCQGHRRFTLCCTFRRLAPPRRYLALCPMKPGLSSPLHAGQRSSGQLRRAAYGGRGTNSRRISQHLRQPATALPRATAVQARKAHFCADLKLLLQCLLPASPATPAPIPSARPRP